MLPHCYSRGQVVPMCCRALLQEVCLNHAGTSSQLHVTYLYLAEITGN